MDLIVQDLFPDHAFAIVVEGRLLEDHLVEDASEGPNVGFFATEIVSEQLRGHVATIISTTTKLSPQRLIFFARSSLQFRHPSYLCLLLLGSSP